MRIIIEGKQGECAGVAARSIANFIATNWGRRVEVHDELGGAPDIFEGGCSRLEKIDIATRSTP